MITQCLSWEQYVGACFLVTMTCILLHAAEAEESRAEAAEAAKALERTRAELQARLAAAEADARTAAEAASQREAALELCVTCQPLHQTAVRKHVGTTNPC